MSTIASVSQTQQRIATLRERSPSDTNTDPLVRAPPPECLTLVPFGRVPNMEGR